MGPRAALDLSLSEIEIDPYLWRENALLVITTAPANLASYMVATAGSIAKLPSKYVATIAQAPQRSNMTLRVLFRNHSENTLMAPMIRSRASMTNHATDLASSSALPDEGLAISQGKHRPAEITSQIAELITPPFPLQDTRETENSWLDCRLLDVEGISGIIAEPPGAERAPILAALIGKGRVYARAGLYHVKLPYTVLHNVSPSDFRLRPLVLPEVLQVYCTFETCRSVTKTAFLTSPPPKVSEVPYYALSLSLQDSR